MTHAFLSARGIGVRGVGLLLVACSIPVLTSLVAIRLRSPFDSGEHQAVLDNGVLVGLAVPLAVLGSFLRSPLAWAEKTASRRLFGTRATYALLLTMLAILIGCAVAAATAGRSPSALVIWDAILLWALTLACVPIIGSESSWAPPLTAAVVCSVPGLVPLRWNLLAVESRLTASSATALARLAVGLLLYSVLDEWTTSGRWRTTLDVEETDL